MVITNCTIWGNSAGEKESGVSCVTGASATIENSIIRENTAAGGAEIRLQNSHSILSIAYSNIAGGQKGVTVEGGTLNWGEGNIDADPLFAEPGYWADVNDPNIVVKPDDPNAVRIEGDYHLKSQAGRWDPNSQIWMPDDVSSPCIDAGDPNSSVAFEPYPNGGIINMGAYGGTAEASKSPSGLHAKYGGGTGEPNDPYLLYTDEHLNALGAEPNDYDKHSKLMADIDLSGLVYDRAVIAPDVNDDEDWFQGTAFTGIFDGNGHKISRLTITGNSNLGLFGQTGSGARISNLGLEAVDVNGTGSCVGGLVDSNGENFVWGGSITASYSTGAVTGDKYVGGLVGWNGSWWVSGFPMKAPPPRVADCFSNSTVTGGECVGGLVGLNYDTGIITNSYSTGVVSGDDNVGGLVGENWGANYGQGSITNSYSTGTVTGGKYVGGLVGENLLDGPITNSYSTGTVSGDDNVGGFVGFNGGNITTSFWDIQTSGLTDSYGGTGLTTAEMQDIQTYLEAGWDFVGETANGLEDIWWILEGQDYPRLWWETE